MRTVEQTLYKLGLAAIGIVAAVCVLAVILPREWYSWLIGPCVFHTLTGLYCPGCGGTRAVKYLLHGQVFKSVYYHPFVLYGGVLFGWFMISHTLERLTGGKVKGMKYRDAYTYVGVAILLLNFVLKNAARLVLGYDILI